MGDMADMLIDQGFESMLNGDDWEFEFPAGPITKTCKFCGKKGLTWSKTSEGWRLSFREVIHTCDKHEFKNGE